MQVNVHEAKTHLSQLLEKVLKGEEVIIARYGKPIAQITPLKEPRKDRIPGRFAGQGKIKGNFNDPLPEEFMKGFLS